MPHTYSLFNQELQGCTYLDSPMLLAETNQWPEDAAAYFGTGDECHMNFHY